MKDHNAPCNTTLCNLGHAPEFHDIRCSGASRATLTKFPSTWKYFSKYLEIFFQVLGNFTRAVCRRDSIRLRHVFRLQAASGQPVSAIWLAWARAQQHLTLVKLFAKRRKDRKKSRNTLKNDKKVTFHAVLLFFLHFCLHHNAESPTFAADFRTESRQQPTRQRQYTLYIIIVTQKQTNS